MTSVETHLNSCAQGIIFICKTNKSKNKNTTDSTLDWLSSGVTLVLLRQNIYPVLKFENTAICLLMLGRPLKQAAQLYLRDYNNQL